MKLKRENLERCLNCTKFEQCKEPVKENIIDCEKFEENNEGPVCEIRYLE